MKKIKQIIIILIFIVSSFSITSAYTYTQVDSILGKYYEKLDIRISNIEDRIDKLNSINIKVDNILKTRKNRLSKNSIELLGFIKRSINLQTKEYKSELEELNLGDIIGDLEIEEEIKDNKSCKMENNSYLSDGQIYGTNKIIKISNGENKYYTSTICNDGKISSYKKNYIGTKCNIGYKKWLLSG
ncbi:MAG: hypothetical protein Q9M94_02030 [Candidatus Gracilibacteria bacterium]|nr:hypothetical protein [Candidatus Gracilibacteria bacterium]